MCDPRHARQRKSGEDGRGFKTGQTHRKVATQSLRSKEPRLHDSGTAEIQSAHWAASVWRRCVVPQVERRGRWLEITE